MRRGPASIVSGAFMAASSSHAAKDSTALSSSRGSARRREYDLLGARRYEVDGIRRPLLAPHLVGDFANDLAVLHLEKMREAHGELGSHGIGNVGHLVADDRDMADLVVEHELLGRKPA